jgi:hypothetical protein
VSTSNSDTDRYFIIFKLVDSIVNRQEEPESPCRSCCSTHPDFSFRKVDCWVYGVHSHVCFVLFSFRHHVTWDGTVTEELERICKEAIVIELRCNPKICLKRLRKHTRNLSRNSRCPTQDSNQTPPEYRSGFKVFYTEYWKNGGVGIAQSVL